ncbi:hypothetical protein C0J52_26558 [Blattella germanica]|nr:hypothetical protein C0J52_26558 [Blattella germanica]
MTPGTLSEYFRLPLCLEKLPDVKISSPGVASSHSKRNDRRYLSNQTNFIVEIKQAYSAKYNIHKSCSYIGLPINI